MDRVYLPFPWKGFAGIFSISENKFAKKSENDVDRAKPRSTSM
jgi:hypothetical protein